MIWINHIYLLEDLFVKYFNKDFLPKPELELPKTTKNFILKESIKKTTNASCQRSLCLRQSGWSSIGLAIHVFKKSIKKPLTSVSGTIIVIRIDLLMNLQSSKPLVTKHCLLRQDLLGWRIRARCGSTLPGRG